MKNRIKIKVNITDNIKANLFLRAIWAALRTKLGGCSWQFTPIINKEKKEIYLGRFSIGSELIGATEVNISYKNKGGINEISFINNENDISMIEEIINPLIRDFESQLSTQIFSICIELNYPITYYSDAFFYLKPFNVKQTELRIKAKGFDNDDFQYILKKKLNIILDLLAGTTWQRTYYSKLDKQQLPIEQNKKNVFSESISFDLNDDHLEKDGFIFLPEKIINIISKISQEQDLNHSTKNLIAACKLYHSALKLEALESTCKKNDIDIYEILITKYMSVLEILSIDNETPRKCESCGQDVYSITKRVKGFVNKVFDGDEFRAKILNNLYIDRSKFLHTGKYFSTRSYSGITIPQLSTSGIEHQTSFDGQGIKYLTGKCINHYLNEIQLD